MNVRKIKVGSRYLGFAVIKPFRVLTIAPAKGKATR